jgi:CDP-glycerol glycerophosphotransferase (TagB/SpsB family)
VTSYSIEYQEAWRRFVAVWGSARMDRPAVALALLDRALSDGLEGCGLRSVQVEIEDDVALACEIAIVRRSGALDADGYLAANPTAADVAGGAVSHFCRQGWRSLLNPSLEFDVWWYWFAHLGLDETRVNPLVHHLVHGRHHALSTMPPDSSGPRVVRYVDGQSIRRACLFAGYDVDGVVDDYVVAYIKELSRHADVYYLADCTMDDLELAKLKDITAGAWAQPHGRYDFGSYARLAHELVGRSRLAEYDEVILANDSAYLLRPLNDVFARMDATPCGWWGLHLAKRNFEGPREPLPLSSVKTEMVGRPEWSQLNQLHVSSYFVVLRRPAFADESVHRLLADVSAERLKASVILKYEIGLSRLLLGNGHEVATFIDDLFPYHPVYTPDYFELLRRGFPLLKRNLLSDNPRHCPDIVDWRRRVAAVVPNTPLDIVERNLLRVAEDDKLQRSFGIVSRQDGSVFVPTTLSGRQMRTLDRSTPTYDHWWAFPVCAYEHTLAGNERSVFERVKNDPSIKKIVLTRSRRVDLDGTNVVTLPLTSEAGQWHVARSKTIFVKHSPRINVPFPLDPLTHDFINLWHGIPLKRFGWAAAAIESDDRPGLAAHHLASRAIITSSKLDTLTMTAAFHPLRIHEMWPTGLPRNDFVVRPDDRLPADLLAQVEQLRSEVGGRRLVMFLPTFKDGQADAYYHFTGGEIDWLRGWMARHDAVLGVREHMADKARTYSQMLAPLEPINLSSRRYPDLEPLYRVADALISDYSSCLVDFLLTGKRVISFAYDYDHYVNVERGLFYDLEKVLPGKVCRDFDTLAVALDEVFEGRTAEQVEDYAWRRSLFFDHLDDRNAARVVRRVKDLYVTGI